MVDTRSLGKLAILTLGIAIATGIGAGLFWALPTFAPIDRLTVLLVLGVILIGTAIAARLAARIFPDYQVAEVAVSDVITRDGRPGKLPIAAGAASAEAIVEQIERADADRNAAALIVKLNTPGGAVVPSEDIRQAVANFDGPTVAYAEDMAASGGYWIATGADEIHARRAAMVGSIGVNATQLGREELREKLGLEYRRFVAGEYKDTPSPWRGLDEDEVEYVQGMLDGVYDQFVETVVAGTDLEEELVEDTEARIYLGTEAEDVGLIDTCGPRTEMEGRLAERLGIEEIAVTELEPARGVTDRLSAGAQTVAHAFGAGIARVALGDEPPSIRV